MKFRFMAILVGLTFVTLSHAKVATNGNLKKLIVESNRLGIIAGGYQIDPASIHLSTSENPFFSGLL